MKQLLIVISIVAALTVVLLCPAATFASIDQAVDRPIHQLFKPATLPAEPIVDHLTDSKINMEPLRQYNLLPLTSMQPIRLEASYSEPLSLKDALKIVLENNLPIKIAADNLRYQKYQMYARLTGFLPTFSTGWGYDHVSVQPIPTSANSRVYVASLSYPIFQGGAVAYSALSQYYVFKAYQNSYRTNVNDKLLDAYNQYTNLVLNYALLQIRMKSYQISQAQLKLMNVLYKSGSGTRYEVMQSRAQLAKDEQALLKQQNLTRQASMALSFVLDLPMAVNFVPVDQNISEGDLLNSKLDIAPLLRSAQQHRPELKLYENFRLSADRNIQVAASNYYPSVSLFMSFTNASATVYPAGNSDQLNGVASTGFSNFNVGTVSNTALNQTANFSPTGSNQGTSGANTAATVVAASGGNPIANTQSAGLVTSGATAPGFATYNGSGFSNSGSGIFPGLTNTFRIGFSLNWSLSNLGQDTVASIMSSKHIARETLIQSNQELLAVAAQVRSAYCKRLSNRAQIDSAAIQVEAADEALKQANMRLRAGQGTNLELIQSQRDYITALISWTQAIVGSNQAQAQLLHDTGLISFDALINGYKGITP